MTPTNAHPPQGPTPPPGSPPGPFDPPSQPRPQQPNPRRGTFPEAANLRQSRMYPGIISKWPEEKCPHRASGTPIRAIISHR